jgi:hypothetical protein
MKKRLKTAYLVLSSVLLYLLHLPFAIAKSASGTKLFIDPSDSIKKLPAKSMGIAPMVRSVYDNLHLDVSGLSRQAFDYAKKGFDKLVEQGKLINDSIIAIADFSQPSRNKRLYVLDLKNNKVLFHTLVAHGKNSGLERTVAYSNQPSSLKSSPGFYVTHETYNGSNGYSLRLEGMERGINDNAMERAIVMHGADYVSESFINARGFIGRSWGCPAVPAKEAASIINTLKGGSCLFIYSPDYIDQSRILN